MGPLGKLVDAVVIGMFAILMATLLVEAVLTIVQH